MPLQHACFLSYKHSDSDEVRELVSQVYQELKTQLALLMQQEPYWDEQLYAGAQFRGELARQLPRSICLVVLYSPVYCQSQFCRSEFQARLKIQEERLRALGEPPDAPIGMIVPIIL